jgi:hypothetical protein
MFDKPNQLIFYINASSIFAFGVLVALLTEIHSDRIA